MLYPHPFNFRGLDDTSLEESVNKVELWEIVQEKSISMPEEEFDTLYEITRQNMGGINNTVTYRAFLETIRNLKRDYLKYRSMFKQ